MSRVQIHIEGDYIFSTEVPVRITDLNYGNHLGNDALLSLIHESRVRFLKHFGYSETDIEGVSIIMADAAIQYKSEAYYDDILQIKISVGAFSKAGFDIFYYITCGSRIIAIAKTGIVCYNYTNKKIIPVPAAFIEKIRS